MKTIEDQARAEAPARSQPRPERRFLGIAVSAGIAIGPVHRAIEAPETVARHRIHAADIGAETARLEAAIVQSRRQLAKLRARLSVLPEDAHAEIAPLLDAYMQMLGPSRLVRGARSRIAEGLVSAETAIADQSEAIAAALLAIPTDDEAGQLRRAEEVREIARRVVRNLTRAPFRNFSALPAGAVLAAEALRPADAALVEPSRIAGVIADEGGPDGHTAIMLRALGVPAVLGAVGFTAALSAGDLAVVDGTAGTVTLCPSAGTLAHARRAVAGFARERQRLARLRPLQSVTLDGVAIELQANLELPAELPLVAQSGATGIGLLRTEFLFMNREGLPDEDAQAETYTAVVEAMDGDAVTIRVLDWGGEKEVDALEAEGLVPQATEANPALALRGIRLLLRRPELLETQLAAIVRAGAAGPVRVLLPMVTSLAEVRATREIYAHVLRRLRRRGERMPDLPPPLGVMIETPGAALSADALALEVDFFALGTNDLAMYTLAVDRAASEVAHLYDPLHPAVLRLVQFATDAARRMRLPISVCGEMAADPRLTRLLLGLGLRSFSMTAAAVPRVKQAVRGASIEECGCLARAVMAESDPVRIRALATGAEPPR
ncbi:MAG TPA: phosphoenolpyruvate--protein phosphotransferase [Acetobacteraceae bacterium]|nr:phosphoenolpyruvate--protein phosphotransferase [Acetobacteraceae bacterium]